MGYSVMQKKVKKERKEKERHNVYRNAVYSVWVIALEHRQRRLPSPEEGDVVGVL